VVIRRSIVAKAHHALPAARLKERKSPEKPPQQMINPKAEEAREKKTGAAGINNMTDFER